MEIANEAGGVAAVPRSRASWSGLLRLSLVAVPVQAYPAISTADAVHLHQLHSGCGQRIRYEKRCPVHGPVDAAGITRGYEYAPGEHVIVEPEELEQVRSPRDKALTLLQFVSPQDIDLALFSGRTLYLLPQGLAAHRPYRVVQAALERCGCWGVGRVSMSGHRYGLVVRPTSGLLAAHVLHDPTQCRSANTWQSRLREEVLPEQELKLAALLMKSSPGPVDWTTYRDDAAEQLEQLVTAKVAGRTPTAPSEEPLQILQLLEALQQSVASAVKAEVSKGKTAKAPKRRSA